MAVKKQLDETGCKIVYIYGHEKGTDDPSDGCNHGRIDICTHLNLAAGELEKWNESKREFK